MKRLSPYDPRWTDLFEQERIRLSNLLGDAVSRIHHMGSTSIPDMPAKPVIDMLAEVSSLESLESFDPSLKSMGYEARGEYGIAGRRYYKKYEAPNSLSFHLHAYLENAFQVKRHLAFRDYLRLKPELARQYAAIKNLHCDENGFLSVDYQLAKKPFVDALSIEAMDYYDHLTAQNAQT